MKKFCLDNMKGGWFVGNFSPTCYQTKDCEVACKHYKKGNIEKPHYHKIATELTLIANGLVKINNIIYGTGDIIVLEPNDISNFQVLEDTTTVVVKVPSVAEDKYLGDSL